MQLIVSTAGINIKHLREKVTLLRNPFFSTCNTITTQAAGKRPFLTLYSGMPLQLGPSLRRLLTTTTEQHASDSIRQCRKHAAMRIWGDQWCRWGRHGQLAVGKHTASQTSPIETLGRTQLRLLLGESYLERYSVRLQRIERNALLKKQSCS